MPASAYPSAFPLAPLPPEYYPHGRYYLGWGIHVAYGNQFTPGCSAAFEFPSGYNLPTPFLIPLSLVALLIGVTSFRHVRLLTQARSNKLYAATFLAYGCMMISAMFADSILGGWAGLGPGHGLYGSIKFLAAFLDMSLTSSIGLSFLFLGLSDLGVFDQDSPTARRVMFSCYAALWIAWLWTLWVNWYWGFPILYILVVVLSCFSYMICEFIYLYRVSSSGIAWIFATGSAGAVGLYCFGFYAAALCVFFTPWWGNNEWWFFFSNCAVYSLYRYFIANRGEQPASPRSASNEQELRPIASSSAPSTVPAALSPVFIPRA